MPEIRVDDLIRVIEARAREQTEPDFPQLELQRLLPMLRETHAVEPRPPLLGRTRYERLWVRINRIVRRVAAHAVEPAVTQQNEFNDAVLTTIEGLIDADSALRGAVVALRAERLHPADADDR